jgi:LPS-assembly protein
MHRIWSLALLVYLTAAAAHAQGGTPAQPAAAGQGAPTPTQRFRVGNYAVAADRFNQTGDTTGLRGNAEITISADSRVFGDEIDIDTAKALLTARGNVVLRNAEGTISASRIELDINQGTGIFYDAYGVMSLGAEADPLQFGGQDPDVYFRGTKIERLGQRRYRITDGAFTTCVQPEPRWEMASGTVELELDHYAIARHTVLRVKGVPVFYLPIVYYPIQEDGRATGFLMPTYGTSRLRGQSLSNGFFWAIGRSHDATFAHDWFTTAGHGYGGEYRYVAGPGSSGEIRVRRFHQKEATYVTDGVSKTIEASTSFEFTGSAVHAITPAVRARARVDYASNIISQQLYQQNLVRATNPVRAIEGAVSGNWGALSSNVSYQRTELFTSADRSLLYGSTPRVTTALAPQRLFGLPIYGAVNSEYAHLPYRDILDDEIVLDKSLSRVDLNPSIRIPLSGLTFLTVNSNAAFRSTYYTRSADTAGVIVAEPLLRTYLSMRSDIVGPVFNKIWDTPDSSRTERRKHVIEPAFSVDYVSPIESFTRVPVLSDYSDVVVGATTRATYGLTNRLFSRSRPDERGRGQAREVLTIGVQQTYYSNDAAGQFDSSYQSAYGVRRPVALSPVALTARLMPALGVETNGRLEYDVSGNGLQLMSAGASANGVAGSLSANYSWRHINKTVDADNYVSTSGTLRLREGRVNGTYGLSWDIGRGYVVNQTAQWTYMAQCCGFQVEFQQFNFPETVGIPIPSDRRINFGVVLSGLGTLPGNLFGAFGGR